VHGQAILRLNGLNTFALPVAVVELILLAAEEVLVVY